MSYYSVWPYMVGMAIVFALAASPVLTSADTPPTKVPSRVQAIDGLRGFLALGVVFHHAASYHLYLLDGKWDLPPARFYTDLGQAGVAMFFMITGYLFWTQMLRTKGRPDFLKLYIGRIFRIIPLYMVLVIPMLLAVGALTGWQVKEPPAILLKNIAKWLSGGLITGSEVNGYTDAGVIGGVTWTLHFEWIFYASLAATSFFARKTALGLLFPVLLLLISAPLLQLHPGNIPIAAVLLFAVGMTSAAVKRTFATTRLSAPQWALSTVIALCPLTVVLLFDGVYATAPILVLGLAFACMVVCEGTLYGILLTRPAKRLGDISYGIYLLQGPVFALVLAIPAARSLALNSAWGHWTVMMIVVLTLVLVATVTHVLVERPGIKAGQRFWMMVSPNSR